MTASICCAHRLPSRNRARAPRSAAILAIWLASEGNQTKALVSEGTEPSRRAKGVTVAATAGKRERKTADVDRNRGV